MWALLDKSAHERRRQRMGGTNGLIHFTRNAEGYQNVAWYKQNSSAFPLSHNRTQDL